MPESQPMSVLDQSLGILQREPVSVQQRPPSIAGVGVPELPVVGEVKRKTERFIKPFKKFKLVNKDFIN